MRLRNVIFSILLVSIFLEILIGFPINLGIFSQEPALKEGSLHKDKKIGTQETVAEQVMKGVHFVESQKGRRDWELFAKKAEAFEKTGFLNLLEIKVLFYSDKGLQFTVKGEQARINSETKDMLITGKVVTQSNNGYTFFTESLEYNAKRRILHTEDQVKMLGRSQKLEDLTLQGRGMELIVGQSKMMIKDKVQTEIRLIEDQKALLTSHQAEFSDSDDSALFSGVVQMQYERNEIQAEKARFHSDKKGQFRSLHLKGRVRMSDNTNVAEADEIYFDPQQNKWVLNGQPRIIQGQDEIIGEQITLLDGGDRIKVDRMRAKIEKDANSDVNRGIEEKGY